jgi:hypothetical protein
MNAYLLFTGTAEIFDKDGHFATMEANGKDPAILTMGQVIGYEGSADAPTSITFQHAHWPVAHTVQTSGMSDFVIVE